MKSVARAVSSPGAARPPRRVAATLAAGPVVGCHFCSEPIEIAAFAAGPPDPAILSTACTNCGLLVSATPTTLAAWRRQDVATHRADDIADRRRAHRVAMGTRAILSRVGVGEPFDERAV